MPGTRTSGLHPSRTLLIGLVIFPLGDVFAAPPKSEGELQYRAAIQQLAEQSQSAVGEELISWLPQYRNDQLTTFYRPDRYPESEAFEKLRVSRAEELLTEARSAIQNGNEELAYRRFWQAAREDRDNPTILRALGLPQSGRTTISIRKNRNREARLGWDPLSYLEIKTPHFVILTRCTADQAKALAADLERVYWIWTQVFFPLWTSPARIERGLSGKGRFETSNKRHEVILFRSRQDYVEGLQRDIPGIGQSTGFYLDSQKITFLYQSDRPDRETRYHELTHQLLQEATQLRVAPKVGEQRDFWVVEGIAAYMESLGMSDGVGTIGGWESKRLQFARYRTRVLGEATSLPELSLKGREAVQRSAGIANWYSSAAAYCHLLMQEPTRLRFLHYIGNTYLRPDGPRTTPDMELTPFLEVTDAKVLSLQSSISLSDLCLARTRVTDASLEHLSAQDHRLRWIDLSGTSVSDSGISRLLEANSSTLKEISLEQTAAGTNSFDVVAVCSGLTELDVSFTNIKDEDVMNLQTLQELETLWLTGCLITDASLATISKLPKLKNVDVQRTSISEAALARFRQDHPDVNVNPLQLRVPDSQP